MVFFSKDFFLYYLDILPVMPIVYWNVHPTTALHVQYYTFRPLDQSNNV